MLLSSVCLLSLFLYLLHSVTVELDHSSSNIGHLSLCVSCAVFLSVDFNEKKSFSYLQRFIYFFIFTETRFSSTNISTNMVNFAILLVSGCKPKGPIDSPLCLRPCVRHRLSWETFDEIFWNLVCRCLLVNENSPEIDFRLWPFFGLFFF